jgi:hypothetical protein
MDEKITINPETLSATKLCQKHFSCLSENGKEMGKVVFCVNCTIHGIICGSDEPCAYRYSEDSRTFCTCPSRKEIYNKYKI